MELIPGGITLTYTQSIHSSMSLCIFYFVYLNLYLTFHKKKIEQVYLPIKFPFPFKNARRGWGIIYFKLEISY